MNRISVNSKQPRKQVPGFESLYSELHRLQTFLSLVAGSNLQTLEEQITFLNAINNERLLLPNTIK